MPVWHEGTAAWAKTGRLVVLGITQEQHADRCRLLAQWKGFDWPILHDPINIMGCLAVPVLTAIDEHGIVRSTRPSLDSFEATFLDQSFADDAETTDSRRATPAIPAGQTQPNWDALRAQAEKQNTAATWRELGDALALWGSDKAVREAIDAYSRASSLAPDDGPILFRLGVCYRRRCETAEAEPGDFQAAIDHWGRAMACNPNQYIWRRRIQQYGPRLEKPYAFYDWVEEAEAAIRARGEQAVNLMVRPGGAEIAQPAREFPTTPTGSESPDPHGRIQRDAEGLVQPEITVVPGRIRPGQSARVHVVLRLDPGKHAHWNNEVEPLRLWIDPPENWIVSQQLLTATLPRQATSDEDRSLDFELKAPAEASATIRISAFALFHVCDDDGGTCRLLRLDLPVQVKVE